MLISEATHLTMLRAAGARQCTHETRTFWALFDEGFQEVDLVTGVETRTPALTCRTSDVRTIPKGGVVEVPDAGRYRVLRHEPTAEGETVMMLARA